MASGIADYLGLDPIIIKIAFMALTLAGGSGILLYLAGWILLPDQNDRDPRPVVVKSDLAAVLFGGLILLAGVSVVFGTISLGFDESVVVPLLLVAGGFYLLNRRPGGLDGRTDRSHVPSGAAASATTLAGSPSPTTGATDPTVEVMPPSWPSTTSWTDAPAPPGSGHEPPLHWATPITHEPFEEPAPKPPVTSVTLAIAGVVVGVLLGLGQLTGVDVGAVAIFGSVALVCGGGLVASAFIGRARPLILVGLLAVFGLAIAPLIDTAISGGLGAREFRPDSLAQLEDTYEVGSGYVELDLRDLVFVADESVRVDVGAGYALITVPADVRVSYDARSQFGYVKVFDAEQDGVHASLDGVSPGREGSRTLTLDLEVTFGYVEVRRG